MSSTSIAPTNEELCGRCSGADGVRALVLPVEKAI